MTVKLKTNFNRDEARAEAVSAYSHVEAVRERIFAAANIQARPMGLRMTVFYACKTLPGARLKVDDQQWAFLVEGYVAAEPYPTASLIVLVREMAGEPELLFATQCRNCGVTMGVCPHAAGIAQYVRALDSRGTPLPLTGVYVDNVQWRDSDIGLNEIEISQKEYQNPKVIAAKFIRAVNGIAPPKAKWPNGGEVVMKLDPRSVRLDDGSLRTALSRHIRNHRGDLMNGDATRLACPSEEAPWLARAMRISPLREPGLHFIRDDHDAQLLLEFAKEGRLHAEEGALIQYAGGVGSILAWEPSDRGGQHLVRRFTGPWLWLQGERGLVIDIPSNRLAESTLDKPTLESLSKLGELDPESTEIVRDAWSSIPALEALLPMPVKDRVIEEHVLTWSAELAEEPYGAGSDDDVSTTSIPLIRISLMDGKTHMPWNTPDRHFVQGEGDVWHRYRVEADKPLALIKSLRAMELFETEESGSLVFRPPPGTSLTMLSLCLSSIYGGEWVKIPKSLKTKYHHSPSSLKCQVVCGIGETGKLDHPYELTMEARVGQHEADLGLLLKSPIICINPFMRGLLKHLKGDANNSHHCVVCEITRGEFAIVDSVSLQTLGETVGILADHATQRGNKFLLTEGGLMRLATLKEAPQIKGQIIKDARQRVSRLLKAQGPAQARTIDGIEGITFSPKQAAGVNWLLQLLREGVGGILADKRGAGKTFQALGAIAESRELRKELGKGPAVVMMELKELDHWIVKHLLKHCHGLTWKVFHGKSKPEHDVLMETDLVVTTYGVFQRHYEKFKALNPGFVFADEAKRLKNRQSKTRQAIRALEGASIVPINGTPLARNVGDVWSGFDLAASGFLGSYNAFVSRYRKQADSESYLDKLREAMKPIFIRRDIDNGRGMPSKTLIPQVITMDDLQVATYAAARERILAQRDEMAGTMTAAQLRFRVRNLIDRLRDITASPGRPGHLTSKGESILEMVDEFVADGHQVLVFSHSNNHVDAIANILRANGIATSVYRGTNAKERNREKGLFQDGHSRVLVLSDLGAKGLDLPEASRVIITDPWIDADEEDQKADRARRFVSTKDLEVFHLICAGTLEEGAMEIQSRNREREQAILEGAPAPAPGFGGNANASDYDYLLSFEPQSQDD